MVGGGEDRHVEAEVADELRLLAERQRAHVGVQPVGAYHEVERARCAPLEGDLDAIFALRDAGDGVVEGYTSPLLVRMRSLPLTHFPEIRKHQAMTVGCHVPGRIGFSMLKPPRNGIDQQPGQ